MEFDKIILKWVRIAKKPMKKESNGGSRDTCPAENQNVW